MVRMRVPIREQLGVLVLLSSLIGLAVIAIATWVQNASFSNMSLVFTLTCLY